MGRWRLWFVLLLPLTLYTSCRETEQRLVKITGSKPDVTPVCSNETSNIIMLTVCKIRTEIKREECSLSYGQGKDLNECDSRYKLMTENQTIFLHLTNLTPLDSGNYTCECSYPDRLHVLQLNITVEENEDVNCTTEDKSYIYVLIGVLLLIIITTVVLGVIHRRTRHRRQLELPASHPTLEPGSIEPYIAYVQRENELYSSAIMQSYTNTHISNEYP